MICDTIIVLCFSCNYLVVYSLTLPDLKIL